MRVGSLQRQRKSSILPVIGGCLAVYAVCAVGFHALVEPSLGKNQPPPPPVLQYSAAALAARAEAVPVSPVAAGRPAAAAPATPKAADENGSEGGAGRNSGRTPRRGSGPGTYRDHGTNPCSGAGPGGGTGAGSGTGSRFGSGSGSDHGANAGSDTLGGGRRDSGHRGKDRGRRTTEEAGPQARGSAQAAARLL